MVTLLTQSSECCDYLTYCLKYKVRVSTSDHQCSVSIMQEGINCFQTVSCGCLFVPPSLTRRCGNDFFLSAIIILPFLICQIFKVIWAAPCTHFQNGFLHLSICTLVSSLCFPVAWLSISSPCWIMSHCMDAPQSDKSLQYFRTFCLLLGVGSYE